MAHTGNDDDKVWCKGDKCLSPYSGDDKLYKGIVSKILRSPVGQVKVLVKFDGYGDEDSEEVEISKLQKVKSRDRDVSPKKDAKEARKPRGMFKPLSGNEYSDRLKLKYELDNDEDDEVDVKTEKLSEVLFERKTLKSSQSTRKNYSRKGVVAVGGDPIKGKKDSMSPGYSRSVTGSRSTRQISPVSSKSPPPAREKCKLEVSGGQAKDPKQELRTSRKLSDLSSIVDPGYIDEAFKRHRNQSPPGSLLKRDAGHQVQEENGAGTFADYGHKSGFTEDDIEKPRFSFPAVGAKVPFLLSEVGTGDNVQVPSTINQYLRDYQRDGIQFLYSHYKYERGAILGDDMGLGKTVQVIGFLAALLDKKGTRVDLMRQKPSFIRQMSDSVMVRSESRCRDPFLIIGPGCVLYNWLDELETWGYFSVRKFHGTDKHESLKEIKRGKIEIVVTTFETFRQHQESLNEITWNAVIVDEVHKIKDMKAQTTKALHSLTTRCRYGLTGTALQNNLLELWCILEWAQPGCLGTQRDFEEEYVSAIEVGQRHNASKRELALARTKKEKFADIRKGMMIRRMKSLIADQLPKKEDNVVFCRLSQLQTEIYRTILDHPSMHLVLHMHDACPCDSGQPQSKCCFQKTDGQSVKSLMFTFMHLLLKASNHVALLIPRVKTSHAQTKHSQTICETVLSKHPEFVQQTREAAFKTLSNPKYCGKMKVLQGLLKVFGNEHSKVLVFSYSTQVLDIIEQYLMGTGHEYRRIDGNVSCKKRLTIVREFNTDPNIFICIISTKAGGLGLNLTGANKVVIFDPNWNPTHDLQAQDRAYRIGQQRNVNVYRLVTAGTIEENMYLRQIYKQQLLNVTVEDENARRYFYAVQGNPQQKGELFGMRNMFRLRTGGSCLTMDILKRNEKVEAALANFDITKYIPPVVRVEEDKSAAETSAENKSAAETSAIVDKSGADVSTAAVSVEEEEEDVFANFFNSQDMTVEDEVLEYMEISKKHSGAVQDDKRVNQSTLKANEKGKPDGRSGIDIECSNSDSQSDTEDQKVTHNQEFKESNRVSPWKPDSGSSDSHRHRKRQGNVMVGDHSTSKKSKVTFNCPPEPPRSVGKVLQANSKTGKKPLKRSSRGQGQDSDEEENEIFRVDQTLAGSFNDVSDVFENCGVLHIHENMKVVGGSRAEDHMTKCAITDVFERRQNSQELAVYCEPMSESSEEEPEPVRTDHRRGRTGPDPNTPRSVVVGDTKVLIGQTPKAIGRKQLEALRVHHKCGSLLDFAELVLGSSLEERVKLLNSYYESLDPALTNIISLEKRQKEPKRLATFEKNKRKKSVESTKKLASGKRGYSNHKKSRRKVTPSVSFIDNDIEESESISFAADDNMQCCDSNEESSMEVGRRNDTPRKMKCGNIRSPQPKQRMNFSHNNKHMTTCPASSVQTEKTSHPHFSKRKTDKDISQKKFKRRNAPCDDDEDNSENQEESAQDLLDDLGKCSQTGKDGFDTVDGSLSKLNRDFEITQKTTRTSVVQNENEAKGKNSGSEYHETFVSHSKSKLSRKTPDISVFDDIFGDDDTGENKSKPPPSKGKIKNVSKSKSKDSSDINAEFWLVRDNASASNTDILDVSTLKDDNLDCFDDPRLWRKMKKKERKRDDRSIVDKFIAESDADYRNLFDSGKLKKRDKKGETRPETTVDKLSPKGDADFNQYQESMSLFST